MLERTYVHNCSTRENQDEKSPQNQSTTYALRLMSKVLEHLDVVFVKNLTIKGLYRTH